MYLDISGTRTLSSDERPTYDTTYKTYWGGGAKMQNSGLTIGALAAASLLLASCSSASDETQGSSLPISIASGSFIIDVDNPRAVVGDADYVFVGQVDSFAGTDYKFPTTIENADGSEKEIGTPYSNFKVTVLENLKGELVTTEPIDLQKWGGISEDKKSVVLYEDDSLPKKGRSYVFAAYAQPDGTLLVSGPNSNIALAEGDSASAMSSEAVQQYVDAVAHQVTSERERFVSTFEADG
ncbi:cell surface protein [Glutamicibacter uratoxydans]